MEIDHLPGEMLLEVHQRLPPSALKMAVLVNKLWKDVGEDPTLWEWCQVTIYSREDITNLSTIYSREDVTNLAFKRLKRIQQICINPAILDADDWEALFLVFMKLPYLKKICGLARPAVEPGLFAMSLAKLEDVNLVGITSYQIQALFTEMSRSTRLKKLHLSKNNLSEMDPRLFGRVLSRLEDLRLINNRTTDDQMEALFIQILDTDCLKSLHLNEYSLANLEPGLFARALSKVEDVSLQNVSMRVMGIRIHGGDRIENLWRALFTELSFGTQMKKLDLRGKNNLSHVEPGHLGRALSRLVEVNLNSCRLTNEQLQAIFTEMSGESQLKKLDLGHIDLSRLEPGLFARVLSRLEDVLLVNNVFTPSTSFTPMQASVIKGGVRKVFTQPLRYDITTDQMRAFFTEAASNSCLKTLDMSNVDLSSLDPEVLIEVVTRLEVVALRKARITNDQELALFTGMSRNVPMKKIDFSGNDLSSVDSVTLGRALNRLEEVTLCNTGITHDQALSFFTEVSQNTQLKKLNLSDDLSTLNPEALAAGVAKLKEVCLCASNLSTEQISSILKHVLEVEKKLKKLDLSDNGSAAFRVNPEIVRKVKEKLKGGLIGCEHVNIRNQGLQNISRNSSKTETN